MSNNYKVKGIEEAAERFRNAFKAFAADVAEKVPFGSVAVITSIVTETTVRELANYFDVCQDVFREHLGETEEGGQA